MKKVIMLSALAGALFCANAQANPATVTFTGDVQATTCTLSADSKNASVAMPDISYADMMNGDFFGEMVEAPYVIQFTGCPSSVASVHLDGSSSTGLPYNGDTCGTMMAPSGYVCPEQGTAKGIAVVVNGSGGYLFPYNPAASDFPVQPDGSVTVNGVVEVTGNPASQYTPGWYATTFTFNFSWT